jgi:Ca-activated chloride channel family protein
LKRIAYTALAILFIHSFTFAQYYLKGEIKDEAGNTLSNASILQCSSGYVFYSGTSGGFGITTAHKIDTLVFSLDGFQKKKVAVDAGSFSIITLKRAVGVNKASRFKLASLTKNLKRETQQQWFAGDETYASTIENQFIASHEYPSTGLTLNVDRASYSNVRRFLNTKAVVPPDAVRIEEMLNYFNFNYTEPKGGKTFEITTALTECPWNNASQLLFATIKSKKVPLDLLPPSNLVFLIDVSGSMDMPNRLPLLKAGFRGLVNNLRDKDSVSIVVYGGTVGILLNAVSGGEKQKIFNVIDSLQPGGNTPGESGIKLAYSVAGNHFIKGGNNRVVLATDGDFNVGLRSEAALEELIAAQRESGIYLTCLGVGMGNYKDSKIQALAQKGNGNFAYIDSYMEAEKVLMKEFLQTLYAVADDVYLNVLFNPAYVKTYRLIGFDNKVGAIRDTAATVEGGEIGSGFSMMVAFEIVPVKPVASIKSGEVFEPVTFNLHFMLPNEKKIHEYTDKPRVAFVPLVQQDKMYQFAAAVTQFGLLLRESRFVKDGSWNDVLDLAIPSADVTIPSQMEFIGMVQQAKNIYGKKRKKKE